MGSPLPALRRRPPPDLPARALAALATIALLSATAQAQTEPPTTPDPATASSPPPATTPAPTATAPEPSATASGGTPSAEPAAPPPATTAPTLTPEPTQVPPPLALDLRTAQTPAPRPVPFYQKDWFWGAVGVVILTTAVILVSVASSGTETPITTLGNMHAF